MFQHTAARRRPTASTSRHIVAGLVSTHSRPKATENCLCILCGIWVGFNTQPPEGDRPCMGVFFALKNHVSTHSRPKATEYELSVISRVATVSTHSRPKATDGLKYLPLTYNLFVSTHSRPKATDCCSRNLRSHSSFNTQPPEGDRVQAVGDRIVDRLFQHTAARRRPSELV